MGNQSGYNISGGTGDAGYYNLFLGANGFNASTCHRNIALGTGTGYQITTGDNNICIGTGAGPLSSNGDTNNKLYIDTLGNSSGLDQIHSFMVTKVHQQHKH